MTLVSQLRFYSTYYHSIPTQVSGDTLHASNFQSMGPLIDSELDWLCDKEILNNLVQTQAPSQQYLEHISLPKIASNCLCNIREFVIMYVKLIGWSCKLKKKKKKVLVSKIIPSGFFFLFIYLLQATCPETLHGIFTFSLVPYYCVM